MKKFVLNAFVVMVVIGIMTSCAPMRYMQIATLKSEQVELQSDGSFTSELPEFTIEYDFWSRYGEVGFLVTNNSDEDIFLNLEKSHFIKNGYAYDYFQNRTFIYSSKSSNGISKISSRGSYNGSLNSNSRNSQHINGYYNAYGATINSSSYGSYSSSSNSYGYSSSLTYSAYSENGETVEYLEEKIICIPAHSSKYFKEFQVSSNVYRECGFPRNPSKKEESIMEFQEDNSPIVFENRLMFMMGNEEIPVNHKFYVSELQNILEDEVYEQVYKKDCNGNKIYPPILSNKKVSPARYYLYYNYNNDYINDDRIDKKKQ